MALSIAHKQFLRGKGAHIRGELVGVLSPSFHAMIVTDSRAEREPAGGFTQPDHHRRAAYTVGASAPRFDRGRRTGPPQG